MRSLFARFASDESGGAAIEYGVITAGICVAIMSILGQIGGQLNTVFDGVETDLTPKAG
jgi:pilus assembly protein Flp/PilA